MTPTISAALNAKSEGFYIGHRLIFPFKCHVLKVIFNNEIFTELAGSKHVLIEHNPVNTSLYLRSAGKLSNYISSYEQIKLVVAEWGSDLTDITLHHKIICEIKDAHKISIRKAGGDDLFIE